MNFVKRDLGVRENLARGLLKASPRQLPSWTISHLALTPLAMTFDALIIFSMSVLSGAVYHLETFGRPGDFEQYAGYGSIVAVLFIALAKSRDLYELPELLNLKSQIFKITIKWLGIFLFLTAVAFAMKVGDLFSRGAMLTFAISGFAALIISRIVWRIFLADGLAVRRFSGRKIVLIAEQDSAVESGLLDVLTRHGLQLAHHFVLPVNRNDARRRREVIAQAISSVRGSDVEEIIVGASLDHWSELDNLLSEFRVLPIPVNFIPIGHLSTLFKLPSRMIGETITIELQRGPWTLFERFVKRVFDVVVAVTALLLHLPLLLMTAIAIKLDSPGPILFRQRRCGFNGRAFQIFKFRTMSVLEDGETVIQAEPNDVRMTRIGKWLRRTCIDELPQLFNVLQGNMSIVGPRPHAVAHDNQFDELVTNYAYRHHITPGLTGWAQVNGYRGRMLTTSDIETRVNFDLWYIDNWSLALDFKIMLMTMIEIVRGENMY